MRLGRGMRETGVVRILHVEGNQLEEVRLEGDTEMSLVELA